MRNSGTTPSAQLAPAPATSTPTYPGLIDEFRQTALLEFDEAMAGLKPQKCGGVRVSPGDLPYPVKAALLAAARVIAINASSEIPDQYGAVKKLMVKINDVLNGKMPYAETLILERCKALEWLSEIPSKVRIGHEFDDQIREVMEELESQQDGAGSASQTRGPLLEVDKARELAVHFWCLAQAICDREASSVSRSATAKPKKTWDELRLESIQNFQQAMSGDDSSQVAKESGSRESQERQVAWVLQAATWAIALDASCDIPPTDDDIKKLVVEINGALNAKMPYDRSTPMTRQYALECMSEMPAKVRRGRLLESERYEVLGKITGYQQRSQDGRRFTGKQSKSAASHSEHSFDAGSIKEMYFKFRRLVRAIEVSVERSAVTASIEAATTAPKRSAAEVAEGRRDSKRPVPGNTQRDPKRRRTESVGLGD